MLTKSWIGLFFIGNSFFFYDNGDAFAEVLGGIATIIAVLILFVDAIYLPEKMTKQEAQK